MLPSDKVDHDQLFLLPFLEKLDVESGLKKYILISDYVKSKWYCYYFEYKYLYHLKYLFR